MGWGRCGPRTPAMKLVIFDLDGTLIDSRRDLCLAVNYALRKLGLPERSLEEVSGFVGEGAARLVERAVAPYHHLRDAALAAWWEHYEAHLLDHTVLYPGIAEALAAARVPLAVHTNKPGRLARAILAGLGVGDAFVEVLGGDEAPRKPDPEGTRRILARQRVPAGDAALVGDSLIDLETARAVPLAFIAVGWGLAGVDRLVAAGSPAPLRTPAQLLPSLGAQA